MAILNVRSVPATSDQNCDPKGAIRLINEHKKYQYASFDSSVLENKHTQELELVRQLFMVMKRQRSHVSRSKVGRYVFALNDVLNDYQSFWRIIKILFLYFASIGTAIRKCIPHKNGYAR